MYLVKVCKGKQILKVQHYNHIENVLKDISNNSLFDDLPEEITSITDVQNPEIYYASEDENKMADDFEFRYEDGIYVYAGRICCVDDIKERVLM